MTDDHDKLLSDHILALLDAWLALREEVAGLPEAESARAEHLHFGVLEEIRRVRLFSGVTIHREIDHLTRRRFGFGAGSGSGGWPAS